MPPLIRELKTTRTLDAASSLQDDKIVLDGFDLTIERGETCVLIGGSG